MKVFITGGSGFIGTNLALRYVDDGHQVTVLSREATDAERDNAGDLKRAGVEVIRGDIRDLTTVRRCCEGAELVHHVASAMREASLSDRQFRDVNIGATRQLLEASKKAGVKRFVYCSSIGAMGWGLTKPANEESPCRPRDVYQVTKRIAEDVCLDFWQTEGLPVSVVRPADVYGPRDRRLLKLFRALQKGTFAMIGDGKNEHHMVYIDDLVNGLMLASEVDAAVGQVFILAGEEPVQLNSLVAVIARQFGADTPRLRVPMLPAQVIAAAVEDVCKPLKIQPLLYRRRMDFFRSDYAFDISKAKSVLGYRPEHGLEAGIQKTADWYRRRGLIDLGSIEPEHSYSLSTINGEPWQITLYRRSLKKRSTVEAILKFLPNLQDKVCLEIGCATGITSYFLRKQGGTWTSVDFEQDHVNSALQMVGDKVQLVGEDSLPFVSDQFDVIVGINFLEHIEEDDRFISEMVRVLKPGGELVLTSPTGETHRFGYLFKRVYGFTAASRGFGHARDGYTPEVLSAKFSRVGLQVTRLDTYSRFFGEVVEDTLNFVYHRQAGKTNSTSSHKGDFHGTTSPMSGHAFRKVSLGFRLYSLVFPGIKALTLLDQLISFSPGYMLVVRATKTCELSQES